MYGCIFNLVWVGGILWCLLIVVIVEMFFVFEGGGGGIDLIGVFYVDLEYICEI